MTLPEDLAAQEADDVDAAAMARALFVALHGVALGWRAPARHDHDQEDAAAAAADAKVTRAIHEGVARAEEGKHGRDA